MEKESRKAGIPFLDKTIYNKLHGRSNGYNRLLILAVVILLNACDRHNKTVQILFTGDILLSRNVKQEIHSRKTFPWKDLIPVFNSADLVIGNLEGAVYNLETGYTDSLEHPRFAIDSADISLLRKAGFKAITVENNHSLDFGSQGKRKTISALKANNLLGVSFENSPIFFNIRDQVISLIAVNLTGSRENPGCMIPSIELSQKIRSARALSDIVIVSVHWGSELLDWPDKEQRMASRWIISEGADIIIGHHPHVIQSPELIDGKPVYFSLGNHLFDQKYYSAKEGMIAQIEIKKNRIYCNGIKTKSQKNSFYPIVKKYENHYFNSIKYITHHLEINGLRLIPERSTGDKIILKAVRKNNFLWMSHPMPVISAQKISLDEKKEGLFCLESHYSPIDNEISLRPYVYSLDKEGIRALWRGSALAWPILDARILPGNDSILCALHRGDSFLIPGKTDRKTVAAYQWNGFGFDMINDSSICKECEKGWIEYLTSPF